MSGLNEQTKRKIALLAGDDLDEEDVDEVRSLVETCPHCHGYWGEIRGCLDVLGQANASQAPEGGNVLWHEIQARVNAVSPKARRLQRFNGWVPALSMAAACMALLVAGQIDRSWHSRPGDWSRAAEQLTDNAAPPRWMPLERQRGGANRPLFFGGAGLGTRFAGKSAKPVSVGNQWVVFPSVRIDEPRVPRPYWQ